MIKTLTTRNTVSHMHDTLMLDGVFKIDHYITGNSLQELHDQVYGLCQSKGGHYEFGRNYRGPPLNKFDHSSTIFKTYDAQWMKDLHRKYSNSGEYGKNIFATHDYRFTGELARNGWLHFDRNWCLKFFIYLTDVDESCGAFSCSPKSRRKGERLRARAWDVDNYNHVKNRIELDYPELLKKYPPEAVEGKAGTLIVFDTNTFHKGGKTEEGKERLVVRLHCG
tara:strand:+ start:15246 stop:15914 length:669 start_codon:yes stop_codon:yes gene_type:complete